MIVIIISILIQNLFKDGLNLREVGALPEYSSREGCGVEVPDSCHEASREFGRLVDV